MRSLVSIHPRAILRMRLYRSFCSVYLLAVHIGRQCAVRRRLFVACLALLGVTGVAQSRFDDIGKISPSGPDWARGGRLLFIGDSITDMKWGRNEADRNHYLGHSYVFLIAARLQTEYPKAEYEFFNRGKSGNTVGELRERWLKDAVGMKPDVLSILIGVNDVGRACRAGKMVDLGRWEADYRWILDASRKANPDLKIVLLDPFVLPVGRLQGEAAWEAWSGECTKLRAIIKRLANEYQAIHLLTQEVFDRASERSDASHWIWDGVHPLPQGHELIARRWIKTVWR